MSAKLWEIKVTGTGGQGIVLAGEILACAAVFSKKNASVIPSYGSQVKGGAVEVQVIISEDFIAAPFVAKLDILIALSQVGYDNNSHLIKENTACLYDDALVKKTIPVGRHIPVPATKTCLEKLGTSMPANLFALGFLAQHFKELVKKEDLEKAIKEEERLKNKALNIKALEEGYNIAKIGGFYD